MASSAANRSNTSPATTAGRASDRSTLLMATIGRSPTLSAFETTNLVCGSGPSAASTRTIAPSTMLRMRSTSPPKSACPGVSTMLIRVFFQTIEVALARIVIPRSRSRSFESMARSATRWFSRNEPDCCRRRSTSVVLPWSTWAMIATLRRFMTKSQFAKDDRIGKTSESGLCRKPAGCLRHGLRIDQSLVAKVFGPEPTVPDVNSFQDLLIGGNIVFYGLCATQKAAEIVIFPSFAG